MCKMYKKKCKKKKKFKYCFSFFKSNKNIGGKKILNVVVIIHA